MCSTVALLLQLIKIASHCVYVHVCALTCVLYFHDLTRPSADVLEGGLPEVRPAGVHSPRQGEEERGGEWN